MAPVVTRELRVTYGSTVVGGTSDYHLDSGDEGTDRLTIVKSYERTEVSFWVLTAGHATDLAFNTACAALETAFTTPRKRLLVEQGPLFAETLLDLNPTTGSGVVTGIEIRSEIAKVGSSHDTGRSRRYLVKITCGNPAAQTAVYDGEAGLRDFTYRVSFLPSRLRTITFSGTYTKLGANNARAQYLAQIATRAGAVMTALSFTGDVGEETWDIPNIEDSLLGFSLTYDELNLNQSLSLLDDPNVARQVLQVEVGHEAPGDLAGALRLAVVAVTYSAWLNADNVPSLPAWWASTGLPWVASYARTIAGGTGAALVASRPRFDAGKNFISASLVFLVPVGGNLIEAVMTTSDEDEKGRAIVPAWTKNPLSAYVYQGPRVFHRRTNLRARYLGTVNPPQLGGARRGAHMGDVFGFGGQLSLESPSLGIFALGTKLSLEFLGPDGSGGGGSEGSGPGGGPAAGQEGLVQLKERHDYTPLRLGLPGYQIDVTDVVEEKLFRLVVGMPQPSSRTTTGGGGSGGSTVARGARPAGA